MRCDCNWSFGSLCSLARERCCAAVQMMEKIQGVMQNPASAMSDPDLMRIVMKLQGMGMGGGGGGMGGMGGMGGGMGGYSPPAAASASAPANIQHITTSAQLASLLAAAPKGSLVVIDYFVSSTAGHTR